MLLGRSTTRRRAVVLGCLLTLGLVGGAFAVHRTWFSLPKRFAAVEEGRLYRSGTLKPGQLERLKRDYHVGTVLSLCNPDAPESAAERSEAERLGIRWLNVPLTGDGASTPEDRDRIRAAVLADADEPMLVHCSAGVNRTGLAVGMYRLYRQGWTLEQVMREMKQFDFEDEPHHENLRQALAAESAAAERRRNPATQPASP